MITKRRQTGFTLLEILVAMTLLTVISVVLIGSLGPWLNFKQKLDTERKLTDLKASFELAYAANAMSIEASPGPQLLLSTGVVSPGGVTGNQCVANADSWQALANYLPEGPQTAQIDGYGSPWCVLITPQLQATVNGIPMYYHNVALVSLGRQGALDPGTTLDPSTGALSLGGDNQGVLVSGYAVQKEKIEQTQARMGKLASLYETYFTARYLANPDRDVTIDYFATSNPSGSWDACASAADPATACQGTVAGTGLGQTSALVLLNPLGVGPVEATSAYESNNVIQVANYNECVQGTCVRSSATSATPPYTALLFVPLPGPSNAAYLVKTVTGNY